jgi:hypothetical protein
MEDISVRQATFRWLDEQTEIQGFSLSRTVLAQGFQVDRLLGEIFDNNPAVTGIKFRPRMRKQQRPMIRTGRPTAKRMRASKTPRREAAIVAHRRLAIF